MAFFINNREVKVNSKTMTKVALFSLVFSRSFSAEMNLEEVLKEIENNNRDVQIQELEIEVSDLEVKKSFKEFLPTVGLATEKEFVKDNEDEKNEWTSDGGLEVDTLNVGIPIFTGFRNTNNYKKSKIQRDLSIQDNNLVKYNFEERGIFEYFEILNNRRQAEISDAVIENLEKERERLTGLFENGQMIPKSELLKVEADIASEKAKRNRRKREMKSAEEAIYLLMGMSLKSNNTFSEYEVPEELTQSYNLEEDVEYALNYGSKASREELLLEEADLNLKLARAPLYPQVSGGYSYRFNKDDDEDSDYQASVRATWEIFSWGSTVDDIRQKKIQKSQVELNYDGRIDEIALEIRDKYREILSLYDDFKSQGVRFELLTENLEIDSLRYNSGLISSQDYLISVNVLSETAATYYSLGRELILTQREYENLLK